MPEPTTDAFKTVMSNFATGVTVMTTVHDGRPHGMTANAVASLSLEPLLVLVCVDRAAVMCDLVQQSKRFALSVLSGAQAHLSEHFADADRSLGEEQFAGVPWTADVTGAPLLDGALAHVDCRLWAAYDGGDHVVLCGEVVGLGVGPAELTPLVYWRGRYTTSGPTPAPGPGQGGDDAPS